MKNLPVANANSVWFFLIVLFVASFALNWLWEMLQMFAYVEMAGRSWSETALICTLATVGDAVLTLLAYGLVALAAHNLHLGMNDNWKTYIAMLLLGAACAVFIEQVAITMKGWSYNKQMPIVPFLNVGLLPLLQLSLLMPFALWIAMRWNLDKQNTKN